MMIRHGDVLLRPRDGKLSVDALLAQGSLTEVPAEDGRAVIAHGEHSGHSHSLPYGGAVLYQETETGAGILSVKTKSSLDHLVDGKPTGEHASVDVPPGEYDVVRQQEIDPSMAPRMHAD